MITNIALTNFKCFSRLNLDLRAISLLCGLNGMGKSSVIQAILVLRQSFESGELKDGHLALGADLADLGTGTDVLFEDAEEELIGFGLSSSMAKSRWSMDFDYQRTADQLIARSKSGKKGNAYVPAEWAVVPPFGGQLLYVNAERLGPRKLHLRSETLARRRNLGSRGEYALNYLNENSTHLMPADDLRCINCKSLRLIDVVDTWLQEITPGAHLELETIANADALIAGFSFDRAGDIASKRFRATNVGFGLSFVLPVIISLLAPPGSLVLIENPEAHLHPRGQTKLAELAARAATAGVQIIVETHSDHFMDGVRISARERLINAADVGFYYFERRDSESIVTSPQLDSDGRLSCWPSGFFDQQEENLARLLVPKPADA